VPTSKPSSRKSVKPAVKPATISRLTGIIGDDDFEPGAVSFNRRILEIEKRQRRDGRHDYIFPGFIDLQVNGAYGIDVMSASVDELLELSHCLAHEGTTGWLPTVITSPLDQIKRCDAIIAEAMAAQAEQDHPTRGGSRTFVGASILGMHLEGPFISPKRLGVHPALNLLPQGEALEWVLQLKSLKLLTLAPELEGALDAIRMLTERGVAVSIGHTDATYEQAAAGVEAGARMFTHVFNAMRPFHHREPGAVGAALTLPGVFPALIADGVHVHPAALGIARRWGSFLTTDRVALAGTKSVSMPLFGGLVTQARIDNGAARLPDGTLAGSIITMLESVRTMIKHGLMNDWSIRRRTSEAPAEVLGLKDRGRIKSRARADLILVDPGLNMKAVFVGGRELD
jgi:N-acetylglucosamine-6-phosphate deacetylase